MGGGLVRGFGRVWVAPPIRVGASTTEDLQQRSLRIDSKLCQYYRLGKAHSRNRTIELQIYQHLAYLMPGTVTMLLEMSGRATAVAGLSGLVPLRSSCLKSCSRMGSIFFGIVTSFPTARACEHTNLHWQSDTIAECVLAQRLWVQMQCF